MMAYARYLFDGRLPWPPENMSDSLRLELGALRQQRNQRLEEQVEQLLRRANLKTRRRVKKAKVIGLGEGHLPCGEIDVLAVDEVAHVVWVIEAKDPGEHFSPMQLHRSIQQFHGDGGYVGKLLKEADVVRQGLPAVLKTLECNPSGEWRVEPVMVTRRQEVAAYAGVSKARFATVSTIVDTIARTPSGDAGPGHC
jgi:hypothetical protein